LIMIIITLGADVADVAQVLDMRSNRVIS
jgi:hypothetical protein